MIIDNMERIVFAGDSVTDMGRDKTNGPSEGLFDRIGFGFVRMIENMLSAWYPERNFRITNSGVSGNTSRHLLERYESDVVALKPDWVNILIGINDVWRQFDCPAMQDSAVMPEEYEQNVEKMILAVKDTVKGITIWTPYYMEPNKEDPMRKRMDEYGAICKKLAEKHGCMFVDFQAMFDRYFAHQHSSRIAWDRVHPNQMGATLMARELLRAWGFDFNR
ncbi:MAG: SGNH/GDSL hydrolase family protein [Oscillospiraceae bacterium]|nr:SGNH/GDSL hydrolase family protein [Oscillospiraceae bacterium]